MLFRSDFPEVVGSLPTSTSTSVNNNRVSTIINPKLRNNQNSYDFFIVFDYICGGILEIITHETQDYTKAS